MATATATTTALRLINDANKAIAEKRMQDALNAFYDAESIAYKAGDYDTAAKARMKIDAILKGKF